MPPRSNATDAEIEARKLEARGEPATFWECQACGYERPGVRFIGACPKCGGCTVRVVTRYVHPETTTRRNYPTRLRRRKAADTEAQSTQRRD